MFKRTALCLLFPALLAAQSTAAVKSPDGNVVMTFQTVKDGAVAESGQLVYSVSFHGKPLIDASALRLDLESQRPLGTEVRIAQQTPSTVDETYRLVTGKTSTARNHYNGLRIDLEETGENRRNFSIEARAYDDAVAFRYIVPDQRPLREFRLKKESTEFRISKDATTYALVLPNYRTMYESEYIKLNASAFANKNGLSNRVLIGLPLLMNGPDVAWMAITEADLRGYSSMYLVNPSPEWGGHRFESQLAPGDDPEIVVSGNLPHHSAWRVLLVADEPGKLIESNVITSLNPESAIKDTSWIRPGLTSWDWWSGSIGPDGKPAYTTETMKYYVDFAARSGFPYMLIDAGWCTPLALTKMN